MHVFTIISSLTQAVKPRNHSSVVWEDFTHSSRGVSV